MTVTRVRHASAKTSLKHSRGNLDVVLEQVKDDGERIPTEMVLEIARVQALQSIAESMIVANEAAHP